MYKQGIIAVAVLCMSIAAYAADTRTVQADFDRCVSVMERVERSIRRYEDECAALKRNVSRAASDQKETVVQELQSLENRLEYFRNRFERSRGQADKIRDDLKSVDGPTCPSCVESSVNLYCRSGETLQTDIEEYLNKAADVRARMGMKTDVPAVNDKKDFTGRRATADSLYHALSDREDACADKAAVTLLDQARINIDRASDLHAAGDWNGADKALGIARSLLDKASHRCGDGK